MILSSYWVRSHGSCWSGRCHTPVDDGRNAYTGVESPRESSPGWNGSKNRRVLDHESEALSESSSGSRATGLLLNVVVFVVFVAGFALLVGRGA